jgi:hypothetical protein
MLHLFRRAWAARSQAERQRLEPRKHDANIFGGGNLSGAVVNLLFTYDTDLLDSAAAGGINGSIHPSGASAEYYQDFTNDRAVAVSANIGGQTVATSNNNPIFSEGTVQRQGTVGSGGCSLFVVSAQNFGGAAGEYPQLEFLFFYGTIDIPVGQLTDPATIKAFTESIASADLLATNSTGTATDHLIISDVVPPQLGDGESPPAGCVHQ